MSRDISGDLKELLFLAQNEKNVKQKKRYDAVLLYGEGYLPRDITKVLHIPLATVYNHIRAYHKEELSGLVIKKQTGQPKKLTDEQEGELFRILSTRTPEQEGLGPFMNWTAPLACHLVEERFGVRFKERGMRDLFYRIGLSYTRPTYTLKKADPKKQDEFRNRFEELKKTAE